MPNKSASQRQKFTGCKTTNVQSGYVGEVKKNLREGMKSLYFSLKYTMPEQKKHCLWHFCNTFFTQLKCLKS